MKRICVTALVAFVLLTLPGCIDREIPYLEEVDIIYECGHEDYAFHDEKTPSDLDE